MKDDARGGRRLVRRGLTGWELATPSGNGGRGRGVAALALVIYLVVFVTFWRSPRARPPSSPVWGSGWGRRDGGRDLREIRMAKGLGDLSLR